MRVLAGGPTREVTSDVYRLHREALERQEGFDVTVAHKIVKPLPEQDQARWFTRAFERVAQARQWFLDKAEHECICGHSQFDHTVRNCDFRGCKCKFWDGLFMVDSDVIVGPNVLKALWDVDAPVVYGVFWTTWPGFDKPLPQVWDTHPYGFSDRDRMKKIVTGEPVEVYGGGACTLFRRGKAFQSRYWPLLDGMPDGSMWRGEDRTFSLGCNFLGIKQMAVGKLPIVHLYTPDQQTPDALREARELVGL